MGDIQDEKFVRSHDRNANGNTGDNLRLSGVQFFEKGTLHGLPDAIRAETRCCRAFWISAVTIAMIIQAVHMAFLFDSALQLPTVTSIRYARVQQLPMPFMTLCGHPAKFFDSDKLQNSNLSLSVALMFASMYGMFDPSVPHLSDLQDEIIFQQALELNNRIFAEFTHVPNSKKLSLFLLNFTIDCDQLMFGCQQGFDGAGVKKNCCRHFRPILTGRDLCYAFDHSTWKGSNIAGVFVGLSFHLNHSKLRFDDPNYSKTPKFGDLSDVSLAVSNGNEQSPLTNNYVAVGPGDEISMTVTTTRVKLMKNCVLDPQLDFYKDYTINNCVWERGFYKHPESPFCSIAFDMTKLGMEFGQHSGNGTVVTSEGQQFFDCSPEYIRRSYLNNSLNYVEWVTRIDVPHSLDVCQFPCDYWEQSVSVQRDSDTFSVSHPNSLVKVTRTGMNPTVTEMEKLGWLDILSLAGGAMGMWAGGSFVTIIQLSAGGLSLLAALAYRLRWKATERKLLRRRLASSQTETSFVVANN